LSFLYIGLWIHLPFDRTASAFGRIAQTKIKATSKTKNSNIDTNHDFFDAFRKTSNAQTSPFTTTTELFFLPPSAKATKIPTHPLPSTTTKNLLNPDALPCHRHPPPRLQNSADARNSLMLVLFGQKGGSKADKQNRKPKKNAASTASPKQPAPSPAPSSAPRVSNQINIPIRRQIRYGKINKQLREAAASGNSFRQTKKGNFVAVNGPGGAGPVRKTSYRKQLDDETIQQKALERQRRGQNPDWSVVLNQTKADPLVLVDGYNVIYKWPRLKKHMVRGDTDRARQLLLEDLEGLASLQRWRIECVFDGAGRAAIPGPLGSGPGNSFDADLGKSPTLAPFGKTGTVRTVFTGRGIEADTYIEGRCAAAPPPFVVLRGGSASALAARCHLCFGSCFGSCCAAAPAQQWWARTCRAGPVSRR